ncbi:protein kinase [Polyangium aurulentum]|nr:protein kinase [Polyangium aurulentum]
MAAVYKGEQDGDPREVAVKVMHPELARDATFARRFRREARSAARISHPNTVRIIDYGVDGRVAYIAMELLTGRDLFEILAIERRLSEARAARILIEICDVLITAHAQGIVHRDLKPENIMILPPAEPGGRERIKVLDFGIAKVLDKEIENTGGPPSSGMVSSALTTVGVIVGTPEYMSPEQCRGEAVDTRCDIYACGVLLYQLVTGNIPFAGESVIDIALKHIRQPPPKPSNYLPFMHKGLEQIILTALEKWPAQRQQTAEDLKAQLQKILPELRTAPFRLGGTAHDAVPPDPTPAPMRRHSTALPVESVRMVSGVDSGEANTMRSPDAAAMRNAAEAAVAAGDPKREGVTITVPNPSGPVLTSSPTLPAHPALKPTGTLGQGMKLPPSVLAKQKEAALAMRKPAVSDEIRAPRKPGRPLKRRPYASIWLLIPVAVLVGITVGAIVFFLTN